MTTRPYSTQILVVIREFDRIFAQASAARCVRTRQSGGGSDERKVALQATRPAGFTTVALSLCQAIRGCDRAGVVVDSGSCIDRGVPRRFVLALGHVPFTLCGLLFQHTPYKLRGLEQSKACIVKVGCKRYPDRLQPVPRRGICTPESAAP